jgi:hypothetical protein
VLLLLSIYSWRANMTIPEDVHSAWPKRISTESSFPYKEALGFLHRQRTGGRLLILGGVPTYGDMLLALRGFTFPELEAARTRAAAFNEFVKQPIQLADFERFLDAQQIDFLVVQYGDTRENQHREPRLQALLRDIETGPFIFTRQHTFIGRREGALDIYTRGPGR